MENPIETNDLGVPLFSETPMCVFIYIYIYAGIQGLTLDLCVELALTSLPVMKKTGLFSIGQPEDDGVAELFEQAGFRCAFLVVGWLRNVGERKTDIEFVEHARNILQASCSSLSGTPVKAKVYTTDFLENLWNSMWNMIRLQTLMFFRLVGKGAHEFQNYPTKVWLLRLLKHPLFCRLVGFCGSFAEVRMTWQRNGIGPWARLVPTFRAFGFLVCSDVARFGWGKARCFRKAPLGKWKHVAKKQLGDAMIFRSNFLLGRLLSQRIPQNQIDTPLKFNI